MYIHIAIYNNICIYEYIFIEYQDIENIHWDFVANTKHYTIG